MKTKRILRSHGRPDLGVREVFHTPPSAAPVRLLITLALVSASLSLPPFAHGQVFLSQWSARYGGSGTDTGRGIAVDGAGDILVVGDFQGTIDFGGGPLASVGGLDVFVAKFTAQGAHVWSRRFGGVSNDVGRSVAVDASGNLYVTGYFRGTADFGGGPLTSAGSDDIVLGSYDPDGNHRWSQRFGSTSADGAYDVAVVHAGGVVITGAFYDSISFGGGGATLTSAGESDLFVARFDADGAFVWSQRYGAGGSSEDFQIYDQGNGVAVDDADNVYVAGETISDAFIVGPSTIHFPRLLKFDANGVFQWKYNAVGSARFTDVAVGPGGDAIVVGELTGCRDETAPGCSGTIDRVSPAGGSVWRRVLPEVPRYNSRDFPTFTCVATDASGDIFVGGVFNGTVDLGGGPMTSQGGDTFLARFAADGSHLASRQIPGSANEHIGGIALDGGDLVVTGDFGVTIEPGDQVLTGTNDVFVARVVPGGAFALASVLDVPGDQGRQVALSFPRAGYDYAASPRSIAQYEIYRDDTPWAMVSSTPATGASSYQVTVPTLVDSTIVAGQHLSAFYVRATTSSPTVYYDTAPATGYSVDNLAPAAPANLVFAGGVVSWGSSPDADLDHFSVFASYSSVFEGGAALIQQTASTSLDVSAWVARYFYVMATDFAGNRSPVSRVDGPGDATAPAVPANFAYVDARLTWDPVVDWDFLHCEIYGSQVGILDGTATSLAVTSGTTLDVSAQPYRYYYATASDHLGNVSAPARAIDDVAPATPANFKFTDGNLAWTKPAARDLDHFTVYGSAQDTLATGLTPLGVTSAVSFDASATPFKYYYVTSADHVGNVSASARAADDVAPGVPFNFHLSDRTLAWNPVIAWDFDRCAVYGSAADVFDGSAALLGTTNTTSFDVSTMLHRFYYVTSVDHVGNASAAARAVDDAAPEAPASLAFVAGTLSWSASSATDFDHFAVYGTTLDFASAVKLDETTATEWDATSAQYPYYYVTAVDVAGNESFPTRVTADWSTPPPVTYVFALAAYPNPFNPGTTIAYELPSSGRAVVHIYDARGSRIASLVDAQKPAGKFTVPWTGHDDAGQAVTAGVYFVRFESNGKTATRKIVLLK